MHSAHPLHSISPLHHSSKVWREMEAALENGLVSQLGVCNFSVEALRTLIPLCRLLPAVNQAAAHMHSSRPVPIHVGPAMNPDTWYRRIRRIVKRAFCWDLRDHFSEFLTGPTLVSAASNMINQQSTLLIMR